MANFWSVLIMQPTTYLVDGVSGLAVHNGVVRLQFMRLNVTGAATDNLEIQIPISSVNSVVEALKKVAAPAKR